MEYLALRNCAITVDEGVSMGIILMCDFAGSVI